MSGKTTPRNVLSIFSTAFSLRDFCGMAWIITQIRESYKRGEYSELSLPFFYWINGNPYFRSEIALYETCKFCLFHKILYVNKYYCIFNLLEHRGIGWLSPNLNEREISCRYDKLRKSNAYHCNSYFAYRRTCSLQDILVRAKIKPTPCSWLSRLFVKA